MKTYNLTTLFQDSVSKVDTAIPKSKAPSRFLSHKGKDFKAKIDTAGFCTLEVALSYLQWVGLTEDQILAVLKNPAFEDIYGLYSILDNLSLPELVSTFDTEDALELAKYLAPVDYLSVVDELPMEVYVKVLPILPSTFQQSNDARRVIMLKHYTAPTWHKLNKIKLEEEARIAQADKEAKEEAEYQAAVASGEIQVNSYTQGMTKLEVEAFDAAIDSLDGLVPSHLVAHNTAKVQTSIAMFHKALRDKRENEKAAKAAKLKALQYRIDKDTYSAITPILQQYGIKGALLQNLEMMVGKPVALINAFRKAAKRETPELMEVVEALIEACLGDVSMVIELLNSDNHLAFYQDSPEDFTIHPLFHINHYAYLSDAVAKFDKEVIDYKHLVWDVPKPATIKDSQDLVRGYLNLSITTVDGGYSLYEGTSDKREVAFATDPNTFFTKVKTYIEDNKDSLVATEY